MKSASVMFLFLMLMGLSGQAQMEVTWGPELKEGRGISIISVPGILDGNLFVFKGKGVLFSKSLIMQKLDGSMGPIAENKIELTASGKDLDAEFCLQFGGKLFMFSSFRNQKTDLKYLYVDEIDKNSLELKGNPQKIAEIPYRNRYNAGDFIPVISRDSSHLLIVGNVNSKNKDPEKYNLYIFDGDMNFAWEKEVTLDIKEKFFAVEDFVIDNRGDVYLTGVAYQDVRKEKRDGLPNFTYQVMAYRKGGSEEEEYTVSLKELFITDLLLEIAPGGDLICAGFYSENGTYSIKGSYYLVIERDSREIASESTMEFEMDFITMNFTEKQEKKAKKKEARGKKPEMYKYRLDRIVPRADGGAVLTAEQYYWYTYQTYTIGASGIGGNWVTHYVYVYNDIIVVSIDPEGTIEWATKIPKRQKSVDDGGFFSSYAMMVTDGALHFIFNDSDRNVEIEKQGKIRNFDVRDKRGLVMMASVDHEGNINRRPLMSNREIKTITRPKFCGQISPTEMLLFGQRGRKNQFGRIVFE
jgi:hypothetical protein